MDGQLMTKQQLTAILEKLPASCVIDAIEGIEPRVNTTFARQVLHNLESEGIVNWRRDAPQTISLSDKGKAFLQTLKSA